MPTSAAPTCSRRRRRSGTPGFTLLEMLVVLLLMSLIAGFTVPLFQTLLEGQVQREATRLSQLVRILRNEAVLTQTDFHLVFDLKEQSYWVEARKGDTYTVRTDAAVLRKHTLPGSFAVTDLVVMGNVHTRQAEERPVPITVDPSGFVDSFLLHFTANGAEYTFKVSGFRTDVDLLNGYVRE
ncbi:MAG: prepilin-type N-terminal cleavage/methylation domain-containing protein [SAR324 cluster bacterium]